MDDGFATKECWHFWNFEGYEDYTISPGEENELHAIYAAMGPYFVEKLFTNADDDQW